MGQGIKGQYDVASLMKQLYKTYKIKFVLGVGDNIYPDGCTSIQDPLFIRNFEKPYSILPNQRWYMCLGNHDYGYMNTNVGLIDNSIHQVNYTNHSKKWFMPSKYYSFVKGPAAFFYLDTNYDRMSGSTLERQLKIMKQKLDSSKERWKIVVGHHTWRSVAEHGSAEPILERFFKDLFKDTKPDLYMCGHDHCKSLIRKDGIILVVSGTGGEVYHDAPVDLRKMKDCQLDYFSPTLGVNALSITNKALTIDFYDVKGHKEYTHTITK